MSLSKTFCPLPWVHQATYTDGSILLCCVAENNSKASVQEVSFEEAWNSSFWKKTRSQMLMGKKPDSCKRCWIEEESGYRSHRITELEVWERRLGRERLEEIVQNTLPDGSLSSGIESLDLRLGNTCNLQCVMCRPHDSSKWLGLAKKMQSLTKDHSVWGDLSYKMSLDMRRYEWQDKPEFWENLKRVTPSLKELIIGGGEPMLLEQHFKYIEYCVEFGYAKNIHLRYHTNLTLLPESIFELWKHFDTVEVFPSLDALGDKNHYVRYPAQWNKIENHLHRLDKLPYDNIKVMILTSVHFLNFYDLDLFSRWIENQKFKRVTHGFNGYFHPGIVMHPEFLSVQCYPPAIKDRIKQKILEFEAVSSKPSSKIHGVLNYMCERDQSHLLPQTLEYIYLLDEARGTNFVDTFPELAEALAYGKFKENRESEAHLIQC